ncbi:MAG: protein-glutamate O-methyltransferase CheR [Pseudomonadota bacterium]
MLPPQGHFSPASLSPLELAFVRRLVGRHTGVVLGEEKAFMVNCRLEIFVRTRGIPSTRHLYNRLIADGGQAFTEAVVDCLLTKETSFFRNPAMFETLKSHVVPEIRARSNPSRLRVWSAACSTGQEPYSVAMLLADIGAFQAPGELDLLATDISSSALEQSLLGEYSQMEISRGLPVTHLVRYFRQEGHRWCIDPAIKARVRFQRLNLLESERSMGLFDIILCRNVGIYFSDQDKAWMVRRMLASLAPGGYLFLGSSESASRYSDELEYQMWNNVIYYLRKDS